MKKYIVPKLQVSDICSQSILAASGTGWTRGSVNEMDAKPAYKLSNFEF